MQLGFEDIGVGIPETIEPDDLTPVQYKRQTMPGDLWALGEHRLKCGDATKRQDQPEFNQYEIIGRVRLCRVGHWDGVTAWMTTDIYHRCSICQTRAEEDDKGDELITPFCPYCGAYMKNAGEIIAERFGGKEAKS